MAFLQPDEYSMDFVNRNLTQGQVTTDFNENASAAYDHAVNNVSYGANKWFYNSNHANIAEEQLNRMREHNYEVPAYRDMNREAGFADQQNTPLIDKFNQTIDELKKKQPDKQWLTYQEISDKAKQKTIDDANAAEHTYQDISSRASFGGSVGSMAGFLAGTATDPINLGLMVAAAPFAMESLPAAIFGNALINTAGETASQFAPGGQRDWSKERGLTQDQVNQETKDALVMAPVGGAVFGGVLHGGGKLVGALVRRVVGDTSPLAQRAAAADLQALGDKLGTEARDNLAVITQSQRIEDLAAHDGLSSRVTGVDQKALAQNLHDLSQIGDTLANGTPTDIKAKLTTSQEAITKRVEILDNILTSIKEGKVSPEDIDGVIRILPEEAQTRYRERVGEIKSQQPKPLDTLANTEKLLAEADKMKAKVEGQSPVDAGQLDRMKSIQDQLTKEVSDHQSILDDLAAKKAELEKNVIDLHDGKFGDVGDQVPAVHSDFMKRIADVQKDIDTFTPEYQKAQAALTEFNGKVDKAERRASRDIESRKVQVDQQTAQKINDANAEANKVNHAELNAAKEALFEQKLIEENKKAYVELFASNPKVDPSRIRELVGFREMMERKANGEALHEDDFLNALTKEERDKLDKILEKSQTTEDGLNKYFDQAKKRIKEDGLANLEHIATNIQSIMKSFGDDVKPKDVLAHMSGISDVSPDIGPMGKAELDKLLSSITDRKAADVEAIFHGNYEDGLNGSPRAYANTAAPIGSVAYNAGMADRTNNVRTVKTITKDVAKQDGIINQDLNKEIAHPISGEKTTAEAVGKEIDHMEWTADFIESCSRGGA